MITSSPSLSLHHAAFMFPTIPLRRQANTHKKSDSSSSLFLSYCDSGRQAASPKTSSHTATLSWHCTGESSAGSGAGPDHSTPPLIILVLRGMKRSGQKGWSGVEVRAQPPDRPAGAGVPLSLQLQWKPLPQWWGARRKEGGERWAGGKRGGRCRWCAQIHTLSQNTPIQQYFPHGH